MHAEDTAARTLERRQELPVWYRKCRRKCLREKHERSLTPRKVPRDDLLEPDVRRLHRLVDESVALQANFLFVLSKKNKKSYSYTVTAAMVTVTVTVTFTVTW